MPWDNCREDLEKNGWSKWQPFRIMYLIHLQIYGPLPIRTYIFRCEYVNEVKRKNNRLIFFPNHVQKCEWILLLVLNVPSCLLWHVVFGRSRCNPVLDSFFVIFFSFLGDAFANKWVETKQIMYVACEFRAKHSQVRQSRVKWSDEWIRSHTQSVCVCRVFVWFLFLFVCSASESDVSVKTQWMRIAC